VVGVIYCVQIPVRMGLGEPYPALLQPGFYGTGGMKPDGFANLMLRFHVRFEDGHEQRYDLWEILPEVPKRNVGHMRLHFPMPTDPPREARPEWAKKLMKGYQKKQWIDDPEVERELHGWLKQRIETIDEPDRQVSQITLERYLFEAQIVDGQIESQHRMIKASPIGVDLP